MNTKASALFASTTTTTTSRFVSSSVRQPKKTTFLRSSKSSASKTPPTGVCVGSRRRRRTLECGAQSSVVPSREQKTCRRAAAAFGGSRGRRGGFTRTTKAAAGGGDGSSKSLEMSSDLKKTALLGVLFAGWYAFNIVFNIYNKQVLKAFPYPLHCTMFQFLGGCVLIAFMWGSNLVERPEKEVFSTENLKMVLPLAMIHTAGNLLTNISLGKVAVSFTHTIKAMEPFFSVLFSYLFLGATPSPAVVAALVPVVGGVAMASLAEASFNWIGFGAAMGSNVVFQSRNVFSKKVMAGNKKGVKMDNITLFSVMTLLSAVISLPLAVLVEGVKFTPAALATSGFPLAEMAQRVFITAATFHLYQQVSYMILQQVTPVTHSVGNCVKRVVVIASSVLFFRNPVSPMNLAGTCIALAGVFAYSQVAKKGGAKSDGGKKSGGGAYTDQFRRITGLVNLKDN